MSTPIEQVLAERQQTHGDYIVTAAYIQELKRVCKQSPMYATLLPTQLEAVDMICHKLGRILCGNPNTKDHWTDIAGYATLVSNQLN